MPQKKILRALFFERRRKIPFPVRRAKSRKIFRKLFRDPAFQKARHVALYYGVAQEVDTCPFLKKIMGEKRIFLPRIDLAKKGLKLCLVRSLSRDLVKGPYGIMEPRKGCVPQPLSRMDLIIVPGVVFDEKGGRVGRGGGYYDRLLKKAGKTFKVGLCFREQLIKKVPMKSHDVRMDRVITD